VKWIVEREKIKLLFFFLWHTRTTHSIVHLQVSRNVMSWGGEWRTKKNELETRPNSRIA
jgi:hypothetical protein